VYYFRNLLFPSSTFHSPPHKKKEEKERTSI
jgi:hypothetical protein